MSIREINGQVILHVIPHVVTSLTLEMRAALNRVSESGMVIKGLPDHLDRILIRAVLLRIANCSNPIHITFLFPPARPA